MITNNYATGYNVGDGDDGDDEIEDEQRHSQSMMVR